MIINSELIFDGEKYQLEYHDADSFVNLPADRCKQVYGVCFYQDKIVIGKRKKGSWGLIGGSIEKGETFDQAFTREIKEESNMRVLKSAPIGYQKVTPPEGETFYQLRFCALVKPLGEFVKDPADSIVRIEFVRPEDYKQYFNWGEIGDRIITRALEIKQKLNK